MDQIEANIVDILIQQEKAAVFVTGTPGSGKTTFAEQYRNQLPVINQDAITANTLPSEQMLRPAMVALFTPSARKQAIDQVSEYIQSGTSFLLEIEGEDITYIQTTILRAKNYGFTVGLIHIKTPLELCLQRNANRKHFVFPERIIEVHHKMEHSWEQISPLADLSQVIRMYK